jgi:hypothetical protein
MKIKSKYLLLRNMIFRFLVVFSIKTELFLNSISLGNGNFCAAQSAKKYGHFTYCCVLGHISLANISKEINMRLLYKLIILL